jgi:hypothetical protein
MQHTTPAHRGTPRAALLPKARWPLEEMLGADLLAAAQRDIEAHPLTTTASGFQSKFI